MWEFCEEYELVKPEQGYSYFAPLRSQGDEHQPRPAKVYQPMVDTPYLFLEFARVSERKDARKALDRWISTYGLLGLAYDDKDSDEIRWNMPEVIFPPGRYKATGGPGETYEALWDEVRYAHRYLSLYEAAIARDKARLEQLIFQPQFPEYHPSIQNAMREAHELKREVTGASRIDSLVNGALAIVRVNVGMMLSAFTYPCLVMNRRSYDQLTSESLHAPARMASSWCPRNLLGAMYLQFLHLISSGGQLSRCKQCGRIISYEAPMPEVEDKQARKPRKDKEYCSRQCRQNHYYHNQVKPRRESGKS